MALRRNASSRMVTLFWEVAYRRNCVHEQKWQGLVQQGRWLLVRSLVCLPEASMFMHSRQAGKHC